MKRSVLKSEILKPKTTAHISANNLGVGAVYFVTTAKEPRNYFMRVVGGSVVVATEKPTGGHVGFYVSREDNPPHFELPVEVVDATIKIIHG